MNEYEKIAHFLLTSLPGKTWLVPESPDRQNPLLILKALSSLGIPVLFLIQKQKWIL